MCCTWTAPTGLRSSKQFSAPQKVDDPVFVNDLKQQVFEADMANSVALLEPLPENRGNTWASIVASQL
jgi:hypothetical protein